MIAPTLPAIAVDNLVETYLAVGSAAPGACIERFDEGVLCLASVPHPVGNFAILNKFSPAALSRLGAGASQQRSLHLYLLNDEPEEFALLEKAGWRPSGDLRLMVHRRALEPGNPLAEIRELTSFEDRYELSRFMARTFFPKQTSAVRDAIARSLAGASVELHRLGHSTILGGVLASLTPQALGIYNLAIEASVRGRGHGSSMVRRLVELARKSGREATLQCNSSLEPWYRSLGFESVGAVHTFALEQKFNHAIM